MKVLMGLISPTGGQARIFGVDCRKPKARRDVGFLPENPYFHEYLNPRELLEFYGRLYGMPRASIPARRDELIEKVGLKDAQRRQLRKFSKGMLQRIGLAQAMMARPKLLVLDEPMSGLDPIGRRFVTDLLLQLNAEGTTIVFSSHILSDVERICGRVVILNRGRKVAEGAIGDLVDEREGDTTFESLFVRKALEAEPDALARS
jgi:ABC-2 type transport system ATP-binding protein